MNDTKLHVIFGIGPVGTALAELLLSQGEAVRLLSRSGRNPLGSRPPLEVGRVDVMDSTAAIKAARGAAVVYNCVNALYTEWEEKLSPMYDGILAAAEAAKSPLVIADNLYSYGPVAEPISESLPRNAQTPKCRLRAELIERMLAAHAAGRAEVAIVQGSDFFGPRVINAHMGKRSFDPILKGRSAYLLGDIDQPHTFTYVPDLAMAMKIVGERRESFGRVWIAPSAPALSPREFVARAAKLAGTPSRAKGIPYAMFYALGLFMPMMKELRETMYQFKKPFIANGEEFQRTFGVSPTSLDEALNATLAWVAEESSRANTVARASSPA